MTGLMDVLKSPMKDEKWLLKTLVGGAFPLLPVLSFIAMIMTGALAANLKTHLFAGTVFGAIAALSTALFVLSPLLKFFSYGFIVARARLVHAGRPGVLPEWDGWKNLFVDGVMYFIICFVYMLIPFLVMLWGALFPYSGWAGALAGYTAGVIAFLLVLAAAFLIPMAVCSFVAKGSLGAAFNFGEIVEKIKLAGRDYISAYAFSIALYLGIYIVSLFLGVIIIGWLLFPFLVFYVSLALAGLFMEIYPADDADVIDVDAEPAG